jgi:hypothetical protein
MPEERLASYKNERVNRHPGYDNDEVRRIQRELVKSGPLVRLRFGLNSFQTETGRALARTLHLRGECGFAYTVDVPLAEVQSVPGWESFQVKMSPGAWEALRTSPNKNWQKR